MSFLSGRAKLVIWFAEVMESVDSYSIWSPSISSSSSMSSTPIAAISFRFARLFLATAFLQAFVIALNVASLDIKEVNVWVSSSVETATALGMILAVFSFVMVVTEIKGIWILVTYPKTFE